MRRALELLVLAAVVAVFLYIAKDKVEAFFYNQGNFYLERSLPKEAAKSYEKALMVNPRSWRGHFGLAEAYRDKGDYLKAAAEYKKTLAINPSSLNGYKSLAETYSQAGMHEEALNTVKSALERNPGDAEIEKLSRDCCQAFMVSTLNKGTEFFLAGKSAKALSLVKNALVICPDSAVAEYTLGYYYFSSGDYINSELSLNKALSLDPKFSYAYKLLSQIYFRKRDFKKELFYAKRAAALDEKDASAYNDLGLALMHLEQYSEAINYMKKAVSLDPDNPDYVFSLGSLYRDNKMFKEAIAEYNKLNALENDYPGLHNSLADIYDNLSDRDTALAEYQKEAQACREKLRLDPGNAEILNNYAYALSGLGQTSKAKEVVDGLIRDYPRYRQAYLTLAKISEKMQDAQSAVRAMEQARRLSAGEDFIKNEISRLSSYSLPDKSGGRDVSVVRFKDGRQLRGKIKKEYPDRIVLEVFLGSSSGEAVFYRDSIESIEGRNTRRED